MAKMECHPQAKDPDLAWKEIFLGNLSVANPITLEAPMHKTESNIRFVCISDTHSLQSNLPERFIPDGDVLIHAGDFTMHGHPTEITQFDAFLGQLPHQHKIVVAGNHEITLDPSFERYTKTNTEWCRSLLTNCTYLQDNFIDLFGYKIYGSPWQPRFSDMAFNLDRGQDCMSKWNLIPADTDILVTHGPPLGHGDYCKNKVRAGCVDLLQVIQNKVKPSYHVFGHIHEGYGVTTNGTTNFINAAVCDKRYRPVNKPIVFDLPKKY